MSDENDKDIEKAESSNPKLAVGKNNTEVGQPRIVTSSRFIQDQRKVELNMPQRLCTFDNMCYDDAVFNSIDVTNLLVLLSLQKGKFEAPKGSSKGKVAADFLNYCIHNMSYGTWMEAINNACTDIKYGFSLLNLVTEVRNHGPYKGSRVIRKLSPRDQKSVYGWVWDNKTRELQGVVQKPSLVKDRRLSTPFKGNIGLNELSSPTYYEADYPYIKSEQLLHFRYNPTNNNPQGDPPLLHCFDAWKEKELVEAYEVVGISRDLSGALVLRVPSELIEKGNDPTNYPNEALEYQSLQDDASNLHAGKSSYIVLSSDVDPATKFRDYDVEFKGIDGGGKSFNTTDVIKEKRTSIYNVFGTGFLLVGQGDTGNYNIADNKTSTHELYVQRNIGWKVDVINNQLATKLLAVNNIFLDFGDMPTYKPGSPTAADLETISKAVQRMKSTNALTKEALKELYEQLEWSTDGIDDLDFEATMQTRSGESNGTSGTGDSQAGGANSDLNSDNKA